MKATTTQRGKSGSKVKAAPKKSAATKRKSPQARKSSPTRKPSRIGIVQVRPQHLVGLASHPSAGGGTIAPGFRPRKSLNMKFFGGRTIPNLSFRNYYLGGARWADSDIQNIDTALGGAMTDPHLNNVIQQYFPNTGQITTKFLGSARLAAPVAATFTRDDVNPVLQGLINDGSLGGVNFDNTVICLMLPPGAVLTTDAAGGVGKSKLKGDDDADSSEEGLGGYHGSCHIGQNRVYFAVGVYSQFINGKPNGIPVWPDSWKNIVATFYHELNEARTDPDVEEVNRTNNNRLLGWYANVRNGGEIGDIPMNEAGANLHNVMIEVALASGKTAPIQLMWSNAVGGPEGPFA